MSEWVPDVLVHDDDTDETPDKPTGKEIQTVTNETTRGIPYEDGGEWMLPLSLQASDLCSEDQFGGMYVEDVQDQPGPLPPGPKPLVITLSSITPDERVGHLTLRPDAWLDIERSFGGGGRQYAEAAYDRINRVEEMVTAAARTLVIGDTVCWGRELFTLTNVYLHIEELEGSAVQGFELPPTSRIVVDLVVGEPGAQKVIGSVEPDHQLKVRRA